MDGLEITLDAHDEENMMNNIIKEVKIEKLVFKGYGLGFKDFIPIFVSNAVPGDIVDINVIHRKKNVIFGEIETIISRGEHRIEAHCDVFGRCGGCDWLNISYDEQLRWKDAIIEEIFRKVEIKNKKRIVGSGIQTCYRNKSFLPVSTVGGNPIFGMFARRSHQVIPHRNCQIQPGFFDEIGGLFMNYLKAARVKIYDEKSQAGTVKHLGIRYSKSTGEILVVVVTKTRKLPFTNQLVRLLSERFPNIVGIVQNINPRPVNTILGEDEKILFGRDYLYDKIGDKQFKVNYKSFFQINDDIAKKMYDYVKSFIPDGANVIDAFSGTGTIGIYVADKADKVFCIESNLGANEDATENSRLNNVTNCCFIGGGVEDELPRVCAENKIDTIIFDPPRKGVQQSTINSIAENEIARIIYVSCNPMTQKRDMDSLIEKGYRIIEMQPFDMFPQTYHIENVIVLEKIK